MPNTREKLIELIGKVDIQMVKEGPYIPIVERFSKRFIETIADHLIANGVTVKEWIPVTEMYPRLESYIYSVDVMFLLASGDVRIGYVNYESEKWKCRDSSRLFSKDDVTHWMPLPEAPKGE